MEGDAGRSVARRAGIQPVRAVWTAGREGLSWPLTSGDAGDPTDVGDEPVYVGDPRR
jgi:hypothetical protein